MTFQHARLRLTSYYLAIMMMTTLLFSVIIYGIQMEEVQRSLVQMRVIINREYGMFPRPERVLVIDEEALKEARKNIIEKLVYTNFGILLITGGAAYFLAGRTLQPIEQSIEIQKTFISDASHEIRTPLTAMRTSLEVSLRNQAIQGEARESLEESLQEVLHLQRLSDSLLNLSQLEGAQKIVTSPISMQSVFKQVLRVIEPIAAKKQITLDLPANDLSVAGNLTRLTELFTILVDNAVKYSPEGSTVKVSWNQHRTHLFVTVKDAGMGIPDEDIPFIFDRFYRSDKSRTSATGGYGLGLAIAKRIVDLHNGSISVSSRVNHGTTFKITLPAA